MIISNMRSIKNMLFVFVFYVVAFFAPEIAFSQFQIKIATLAPQNSEWAQKFLEGSAEIQKKTDNRVKLKSIEVDQEHEYGRGGKNKYKSLSEFQDAINKARKENE